MIGSYAALLGGVYGQIHFNRMLLPARPAPAKVLCNLEVSL